MHHVWCNNASPDLLRSRYKKQERVLEYLGHVDGKIIGWHAASTHAIGPALYKTFIPSAAASALDLPPFSCSPDAGVERVATKARGITVRRTAVCLAH